jgi:hypothetical protein
MAQRIQTLCDEHGTRQEDVDGTTWTIQVTPPGGKPQAWDVDLCDDCGKPLHMALEHLSEIGRKAGKPPAFVSPRPVPSRADDGGAPAPTRGQWAGVGDVACPICGTRPASNTALRNHLREHHQTSYASAFNLSEEDAPHTCPDCGLRFEVGQALGAHRRAAHDVVSERVRQGR